MPLLGYFGITNDGVNLVINLLILFLVVIWFALIYWTYSDARRRIADPMLIYCAAAASLFPFVGTTVYTIVRPPEYLDDVRERELEMEASEARLAAIQLLCLHCDHQIERDYLVCPNCLNRLKDPCQNCGKPLEQTWTLCPYCENPARPKDFPPAEPRRARRRRATAPEDAVAGEAPPTAY
jgi:RNA polymerase subunit RPABC4/transcription elongation factor Spt4